MAQLQSPAILESSREPHSVSLKVLRLSRPSLSIQQPLPESLDQILSSASYAYPIPNTFNNGYILSPLLTLPPAFGYAYVGETFSCTLCANNEILPGSTIGKSINAVRIEAEVKTPSSSVPTKLDINSAELFSSDSGKKDNSEETGGITLAVGESLQKIVQFELKEEGNHVLSVSVTYSELSATSGRVRTFRKLYQFACKNCVVIRSKTSILPSNLQNRWALESQIENCGEETITLENVYLNEHTGFSCKSLNWDVVPTGCVKENPKLMPGDVYQVCFFLEEDEKRELTDKKQILVNMSLCWRGAMGNKGFLSINPLGTK
ncbi:putative trafficking protein particle complex subunit 13-like protein [Golovinomyces cichoracearum]|uniref:Putative trafficking protein particle complex subunit 13-like protein n=1 Tax=Golovinomyces cichoracearum TaxID=62708 RepID=A0A420IQI1_9PEZI|nr:putative trafficking protein particle complex subunit 13-like protein [Golovinomyces cichoracearum]